MKAIVYNRYPLMETFTSVFSEMTGKALNKSFLRPVEIKNNLHVLLADDDEDDREFFSEVIAETAPKALISTVCNGAELMDFINTSDSTLPDMIFLDLNMPCMNGKECLKELKSNPRFQHIPVIIYSTSSNAQDIENAYNEGADYYITKPTTYRELKKVVKKVFCIDWTSYFFHSPFEKFVLK